MLHFLASKSHWKKHVILPAVLLCFQETCLWAEPSWCQCKTIHNKRNPKKTQQTQSESLHFKSLFVFYDPVNIRDPWQACSIQSTYLSSSIWAWIWWSGRHPTWHHDKVNSIVRAAQGRSSLTHSLSLSLLPPFPLNCGCSDDPNATVNTDDDKPWAHNQIKQIWNMKTDRQSKKQKNKLSCLVRW